MADATTAAAIINRNLPQDCDLNAYAKQGVVVVESVADGVIDQFDPKDYADTTLAAYAQELGRERSR